MMTFESARKVFETESNRALSMPLAGAVVWTAVGLMALVFSEKVAVYLLLFATGAIFPLALMFAKLRNEKLVSGTSEFAKLMGMCVLMVNLLWALHIPLVLKAPEFVPLSLGIGLGLHWVVYSWIIQHPLGLIHAVLRTMLVVALWYLFPASRLATISAAIVACYALSIIQMSTRVIKSEEV